MAALHEEVKVRGEGEQRNLSTVHLKPSPSPNSLDKAVRAQGGFVVKPHQVKAMILAARRAYLEQAKLGLVDDGVGFDAWRRATLHDVVGAAAPSSFRAVTQRDYVAVMAYFLELAGEEEVKVRGEGEQNEVKVRGEGEQWNSSTLHLNPSPSPKLGPSPSPKDADEWRRALWALCLEEGKLADRFGGPEGTRRYVDSLFWKIHKTDRLTANARQVWAVIFTLRKRAATRRAKTALGALGASDAPSLPPDCSERFPAFSRGS